MRARRGRIILRKLENFRDIVERPVNSYAEKAEELKEVADELKSPIRLSPDLKAEMLLDGRSSAAFRADKNEYHEHRASGRADRRGSEPNAIGCGRFRSIDRRRRNGARNSFMRMPRIDVNQACARRLAHSHVMAIYRIHFVDHGNRSFAVHELDCALDDEAVAGAHKLDVPFIGAGFDVWQDDRLVHRHRR